MATVRPPHLSPRRPAPAPPPPSSSLVKEPPPTPAVVVARGQPQLPYYSRVEHGHGWKEGVAESRCPAEAAAANGSVIDLSSDSGGGGWDDDDGCGSCVDGEEGTGRAGRRVDEKGISLASWWSQDSSSCYLWPPPNATRAAEENDRAGDDDDQEAAARRQEEDRKFWEACLASGLP